MKKCFIHLKVFSALFLIITRQGYKTHGQSDVQGIWSGTVKMKQEYTGELGHSVLEITTTFSANKGSGSMKYEAQWKAAFGVRNVVCNGSGNAELYHLDISEEDNVYYSYYIHVIGPDYTCSPVDDNPGQDARDITISDKVAIPNNSILSGTKTETAETGTGPVTTTLSWHLTRATVGDVELIVTPEKYDTWLPEPGMNELTVGSVMNISLKLQARGGGSTTKKAKAFELKLSNTSREPGVTINFPIAPWGDPMPDLRFMIQPNASFGDEGFQSMKINCSGCQSGRFRIGSYDGGGWTILTAEAILSDDTRIQGHLLVSGGETEIRIPKRDPNSKIGTAWLTANGNPNEMDDKDTSNGNSNNGDGLTAYEEYRGVISEGRFKRLKPDKKELGVKIKRAELSLFTEVFQWFENASDLEIIRFYENEIARNRRLNKNALSAHDYDQFVLRVEKTNLPAGIIGTAYRGPDIPAVVDPVVFDWAQIQSTYQFLVNQERPASLRFTLREMLAWAVTHELAHAVNVWHHGEDLREPDQVIVDYNPSACRIFDRNGNEIITRRYSLENIGKSRGTVESGDIFCPLSYNIYYSWGYTVGADGAKIFNRVPLLPVGNIFCTSNAGTAINATLLYFGDAAKGNCLSQIKLR
jgi:hypothetical protein